jgi:hypothetical protein
MLDLYLVKDEEEGAIFTYLKKKNFFLYLCWNKKLDMKLRKNKTDTYQQ